MELFVVVIALAFIQVWGSRNPLHNDTWFDRWVKFADENVSKGLTQSKYAVFLFVGVPLAVFWLLVVILLDHSVWTLLPVSVLVLLYAFGRGEFSEIVREYTQACYIEDWSSAIQRATNIGVDAQNIKENDWSSLHQCVLDEAAYRGFERMFAVLFWFFLLGPVAALGYRLLFIFTHSYHRDVEPEVEEVQEEGVTKPEVEATADLVTPSESDDIQIEQSAADPESYTSGTTARENFAEKFLWLLEWPAVRLLSLTFALTGNFAACAQQWRQGHIGSVKPTKQVLSRSVMGALSITDELDQTCEVTRKQLTLLTRLFTRTLWLWLALAAFLFLFS